MHNFIRSVMGLLRSLAVDPTPVPRIEPSLSDPTNNRTVADRLFAARMSVRVSGDLAFKQNFLIFHAIKGVL